MMPLELRFGARLVAGVDEKLRQHDAEVGAIGQSLQRRVYELDGASLFAAASQDPGQQRDGVLVARLLRQHGRRIVVRLLLAAERQLRRGPDDYELRVARMRAQALLDELEALLGEPREDVKTRERRERQRMRRVDVERGLVSLGRPAQVV